jgi:thiol-disulfide isomerase/thioredoxin
LILIKNLKHSKSMKKIKLSVLMLLASFSIFAQSVIENPKIGFSTAPNAKLTKVEITDSATVLYFNTTYTPGNWISIPDKTFIQEDGAGNKFYIRKTEGIPLNDLYFMPASGQVSYKLFFPPIGKSTKTIDYGEANDGGTWFIYDIRIKPSEVVSVIPKEILGSWLNVKSGNWEVSFLDSTAIYKSQLWKYNAVNLSKGKGSIKLTNKGNQIELFVTPGKKGVCMIGESLTKQEGYTTDLSKLTIKTKDNEKSYQVPEFKPDSATYCGFVNGYTPRIGIKTFSAYVDNIITGEQNAFLGKISGNGFFSVKFPIYFPQNIWVRSSMYNGSVYLEPGKTLFQLFDPGNSSGSILFMGELAELNSDLQKLQSISSFNYTDMRSKILDMKPNDYKAYCLNFQKKDMRALDSVMHTKTIGAKAYQLKKMSIDYRAFCNLMEYKWSFEGAYREKYKIPQNQRTIPVKIDSLTSEYYNFLTNENVNNPLAILSNDYNSLINRLKYLDFIMGSISTGTWDIVQYLLQSGYNASEYEKTMFEKMKEIENSPERKAYQEQVGKPLSVFMNSHMENIQSYNKEKNDSYWGGIEKYFSDKGIQLSEEEKQLMKNADEYSKTDFAKKEQQFYATYGDSLNKYQAKYGNMVFTQKQRTMRTENLENKLGIKKGLATDIMNAQDACHSIVAEYSPVSDSEIKTIRQQISTPYISEYIALANEQTKLKIEANKLKTGFVVNEVPKTEADQLFDGIMKKYKGKVVYVDFWATWCGPCRLGIEQIKPLKDEMAEDNVAFVYITGPSSPKGTWENMIPDIKGEHYRVSDDEWNYLCSKFNISGIPHYALVGKNGEVINPQLGHMNNVALKTELLKRINE